MKTQLGRDEIGRLSKQLTDSGRIVEAGWAGFKLACIPPAAPQVQIDEMRKAFFAGAQHLFSTLCTVLDEDREPTADDLRRMELISAELEAFIGEFKKGLN